MYHRHRRARAPAILALAALTLVAPLAAVAQAPTQTFTDQRIDRTTVQDVEIQASVVTSATVRSSDVFDSRLHGTSVFTSNLEANAISSTLLRNDRMRLAALDRVTVEDSVLQGVIATRTSFRATELNDFSIRGANVQGGALTNGIIQDVSLSGGVLLCNVYDRSSARYFTTGCTQLGETTRPESEVRDTGRDLEQTLRGALTLARNEELRIPEILEQGFFVRADEDGSASVDEVLAEVSEGSLPDAGEEGLPASSASEAPALPADAETVVEASEEPLPQDEEGLPASSVSTSSPCVQGVCPPGTEDEEGLPVDEDELDALDEEDWEEGLPGG